MRGRRGEEQSQDWALWLAAGVMLLVLANSSPLFTVLDLRDSLSLEVLSNSSRTILVSFPSLIGPIVSRSMSPKPLLVSLLSFLFPLLPFSSLLFHG